jgi:hypothetical protein
MGVGMEVFLTLILIGGMLLAQDVAPGPQPDRRAVPISAVESETSSSVRPGIPPVPRGKSTIFGGEIRNVDPVRDQLTLKVFGERPMKILFDERTQVFRDGARISLRDLSPSDHASIQTTLDGTDVFAVSIHILSQSPEGEYQGQVLNYNPATGELVIGSGQLRGESFRLRVERNTSFIREGESAFRSAQAGPADLVKGALVSVSFESGVKDDVPARQITIFAVPGSAFVFSGNISSLDLHSGLLILVDPRDEKSYQVFFNAANLPGSQNLHLGDHVRVVADYDGSHYVANKIAAN